MLAGCPAETVTELGTSVDAECPQLQLCPLAPALGGAEPALRAWGLQGAGEMVQHENSQSSVPGSERKLLSHGRTSFLLHSKVFGVVSLVTQI